MNKLSEIIPNTFAESLGISIMHSLWQIALIGLFLWFALFLARKSKAVVRYRLSMGALLLMVALPVLTFMSQDPGTTPVEAEVAASELSASPPDLLPVAAVKDTVGGITLQVADFFTHNAVWITLIWLVGMAVFAIRLVGGYSASRLLRKRGVSSVSPDLEQKMQALAAKMGIRLPVRILQSTKVTSPMVMGSLKPLILIPASIIGQMQPEQLEYILLHELAHVRRWDYLANILQSLAEVLLFFHPVVWIVSKQIRQERENCCDEWVLTVKEDKIQYARALLSLETLRQSPQGFAVAANGGKLFQRIRRITGGQEQQPRRTQGVLALLLVVSLIIGLSTGSGFKAQIPMDPTFGDQSMDQIVPRTEEASTKKSRTRVTVSRKKCDKTQDFKEKSNPLPLFQKLFNKDGDLARLVEFIPRQGHNQNVFQFVSQQDSPITRIVIEEDDGTRLEMHLDRRGNVASAKVNGEPVRNEDLPEYQARLDEAFGRDPNAPMPPSPKMRGMDEEQIAVFELKMEELGQKLGEMGEHLGTELQEQLGDPKMWEELTVKLEKLTEGLVGQIGQIDPSWSEEEWEAWGEKMEKWGDDQEHHWEDWGKKWEEWGEAFAEKWEANGENWEKWGEEMEAWGEKFGAEMEKQAAEMEREMEKEIEMELDEDMRNMKEDLKVQEELLKEKYESLSRDLRRNLEADQMIERGDRFKLELKNGKMYVNGQKQSKDHYNKYRRIIQKHHGVDFEGDMDFSISQSKKK